MIDTWANAVLLLPIYIIMGGQLSEQRPLPDHVRQYALTPTARNYKVYDMSKKT